MTLALIAALVLANGDDPYCRSRVDTQDPLSHCLWWDQKEVVFHHNDQGNPDTTGETEYEATRRSLESWNAVSSQCGHLTVREGPRVPDRIIGVASAGGTDRNIVVYRQRHCADEDVVPRSHPCWAEETCMNTHDCWFGSKATIGLTTTTYETNTGRIFDADVELNAAWFVFTTVDGPVCVPPTFNQNCVATDVENTMTHEIGHALGLDHTTFPGSTMNPTAPGGETQKRILDPGSKKFVCDTYPAGAPPRDCVILAVDGENNVLGARAGCLGGGAAAFMGAALALVLGGRRRRAR